MSDSHPTNINIPPVKDQAKNIVVIGGGVTGVMTAWELSRIGHKVTLVEARSLGSGSSQRSAAAIRAQFSTPSTVRGMRYAIYIYENWCEIVGASESPIRQDGYLFLYSYIHNKREIRDRVAMQNSAGLKEVEWMEPEQIEEKFPYLEITGIIGATWCPKDGFLFPHLIYQDGAEAAKKNGIEVIQNNEAVKAEVSGGKALKVELETGMVLQADYFINATNSWAQLVSGLFGGYDLPIINRRRYLYFLKGLKGNSDDYGLSTDDFVAMPMIITPQGAYCHPDNEQLMMGWLQYTDGVVPDFDNQDDIEPGFEASDMGGYAAAVRKEIANYLFAAAEIGRIEAVTTGFYADTEDHNPLIGFDPNVKNLIHVAGFSGHGLMHAPFSSRIVAELIKAGEDVETIELPGFGNVDLRPYKVSREFRHSEGIVI
ncbi:MAG: FAD-binding oxidoreductase [Candidatus Hatepunaea meridiana]|nr:FAD-binding oxidoreductase [Candidatus Hatepunaea meridiana]